MKKQLKTFAPPIILLLLFILVMNSSCFFMTASPGSVPWWIKEVQTAVEKEDWAIAANDYKDLAKNWEKSRWRLQFSVEKDQIESIEMKLARIESFIASRDRNQALAELAEMAMHWEKLNG